MQPRSLQSRSFCCLPTTSTCRHLPGRSTFKPQFTIALIPWLAFWTTSDWHRRRPLAWSVLTTMLLLVLVSEWLVPSWISSFLNVLGAYRHYTFGHSLLDVWFTPRWGLLVAAGFVLSVFAFCWRHRLQATNPMSFPTVIGLLLAVTLIVIPTLAPHAQLLLLPGFLCLLRGRTFLLYFGSIQQLVGRHLGPAGLAMDCCLRSVAGRHPLSCVHFATLLGHSAVNQPASAAGRFICCGLFAAHRHGGRRTRVPASCLNASTGSQALQILRVSPESTVRRHTQG